MEELKPLLNYLGIPFILHEDPAVPMGLVGTSPPSDDVSWYNQTLQIGGECPKTYILHEISHWIASTPEDRLKNNWGFEEPNLPVTLEIEMEENACRVDMVLFERVWGEEARNKWAHYISTDNRIEDFYNEGLMIIEDHCPQLMEWLKREKIK